MGALWAIGQGLLTAVVPQLSEKFLKRMLAGKFENADDLETKPAYRRQLRAVGIGLTAAGIATLAMESVVADDDDPNDAVEQA